MNRPLNQQSVVLCRAPALPASLREPRCIVNTSSQHHCVTNHQEQVQVVEKMPIQINTTQLDQPDFYQEEGTDVGPRCLKGPVEIDAYSPCETMLEFAEVVATYNLGLKHHERHELEEACVFYECVLHYVYGLLQSLSNEEMPSNTLLTVGMHAHNNLGAIFYCNGEDDDARNNFGAALVFARQLMQRGKHHHVTGASVLSNWCRVHWMRGDIAADALFTYMDEVLRLRSEALPWYHVDVASSHFNLAGAYHARGQSQEAISHFKQYLEIAAYHVQNKLNMIDPIPALVYLLLIQYEDKDDAVSQDLARGLRTLQDKRQEQGNSSAEVASVLNYVGTLLFHCKEFDNSLLFFQEELRIEEGLDERDRVSLSVTCNNIGRTLQEQGKLKDAIVYYKRALSADFTDSGDFRAYLKETRRCRDTTATNLFSTVWYNLGLIHDKLGDATEAVRAFQISLNLRKLILGPLHPDIACLWYNIGVLQMERGFLDDAHTSFKQALEIRAECLEHQLNDERVLHTLQKLTSLQKGKGNLRGAIAALEQTGVLLQQSTSLHVVKRQKEVSTVFFKMAELYHDLNETESSFAMARSAVEAVEYVASTLLHQNENEVTVSDKLATVEQWALSHLLVGSLLHENCESQQAYHVLQQLVHTLDTLVKHPLFSSSSLLALKQVVEVLATEQCAPEA